MTTCGINKGANSRYMVGPNIEGCEPSTFLPSVTTLERSYNPFDNYPNPHPLKTAPTSLPWKASSYYGVCKAEPDWPCAESMPKPMAAMNKMRYLDDIKVPPVFSANRNALYSRYSPRDWCLSNQCTFLSSNRVRCASEFLRNNTKRIVNELDERSRMGQEDTNEKLKERLQDLSYWRCEVQAELDRMVAEMEALGKAKNCLDRAINELNNSLFIDQEILYNREKRQGIELVHDEVEEAILKEVDLLKSVQEEMRALKDDVDKKSSLLRAAFHELEKDLTDKFIAQRIDNNAFELKNTSRGIYFFDGIERIDNSQSVPETWAKFSDTNIKRAMQERKDGNKTRGKIEEMLTLVAEKLIMAWNDVNSAISSHVEELQRAKYKLQAHLTKTLEEILECQKAIELLKMAIEDKAPYMKVAQTRLESRHHRPNMENTRDHVQNRLTEEIYEVCDTVDRLKLKLREVEDNLQRLLRTKTSLEHDLALKMQSLFIDREKNLGLRKSYPMAARAICY